MTAPITPKPNTPIKPKPSMMNKLFSGKKKRRDVLALSPGMNTAFTIFLGICCILTLIPIYVIVISSLTSEASLARMGYQLWPEEFSIEAYTFLFNEGSIVLTAYKNTVLSTTAGTILSVLMVGLYAYPLSRPNFKFKTFFTFFAFFTMLFSGGLVAYYMVARQILNIQNSIWALFLPSAFSPFWVIVMRTFYQMNVPNELIESARIDGANEWRTLFQIVMPLAVPGLATVALFSAIGIWNNFFNCLLLVDEAKYYNLQFTIYTTLNNIRFLLENADKMQGLVNVSELPSQTFRMAMAVVTVGPIIFAYPFFQRYFIRGLTIGAVKG
jgi:putative aldouronate transport system permease protein